MGRKIKIASTFLATMCLANSIFATTVSVNGKPIEQATISHNGSTYVPLRAIGEMFGAQVNFDNATNSVDLVTPTNSSLASNLLLQLYYYDTATYAERNLVSLSKSIQEMLKYENYLSAFKVYDEEKMELNYLYSFSNLQSCAMTLNTSATYYEIENFDMVNSLDTISKNLNQIVKNIEAQRINYQADKFDATKILIKDTSVLCSQVYEQVAQIITTSYNSLSNSIKTLKD